MGDYFGAAWGSIHQPVGDAGAKPHAHQCDPGGQGKNGATGHAGTHGAATRQHGAKAHQNGTGNIAAHAVAVREAFEFQVAPNPGSNERARKYAREQTEVKADRWRGRGQHPHQPFSGWPAEGEGLHLNRLKRVRRHEVREPPGRSHGQPGANTAHPFPQTPSAAHSKKQGGSHPHQAKGQAAPVAQTREFQKIA